MFLLNTNVVSELRTSSAGAANPGVMAWANDLPGEVMFISVITVHELEHGGAAR